MTRYLGLLLVVMLAGCAQSKGIVKGGASKVCQDTCGAVHKGCTDKAASSSTGSKDGLGGMGRELALKEETAVCDASFNRCVKQCG